MAEFQNGFRSYVVYRYGEPIREDTSAETIACFIDMMSLAEKE